MERAEAELLAGRAQAIAKGWLLTLLERAPLDAVAAIPAADLASEGPAVCAALARALGSDGDLDRLRPAGDLAALVQRIAALSGAHDAIETLAAVDALRACLWAAAVDARGTRTDDLAPLVERLAEVALVVGTTALETAQAKGIEGEGAGGRPAAAAPSGSAANDDRAAAPPAEPVVAGETILAAPPAKSSSPASGPARQQPQSLGRQTRRSQRERAGEGGAPRYAATSSSKGRRRTRASDIPNLSSSSPATRR